MLDVGNIETEEMLKRIERQVAKVYRTASEDAQKIAQKYFGQFMEADKKQRALLKKGELTEKEYNKWKAKEITQTGHWVRISETMAQDYRNADKIAKSIINGYRPEAYAVNHNFATYEVEKLGKINTSYTLYNREAVERMWRKDPDLLPDPSEQTKKRLAEEKAVRWHKQQIQSVTMQSILEGDSIDRMARRITEKLSVRNTADSVRYARTAMTGAQNAGREDAFQRMVDMGVKLKQEWIAVFDDRTRHEHRILDGQKREVGEPFEVDGEEIMYPGDPSAADYLVWNCRCRLGVVFEGLEDRAGELKSNEDIGSYEEWKHSLEKPKVTETYKPSFFEELSNGNYHAGELKEAFGDMLKEVSWAEYGEYFSQKADRVEHAIAELENKYPMQYTGDKESMSTPNSLIICDYSNVGTFLPNGFDDRRIDTDLGVMAQVFENSIGEGKDEIRQAVIAFNRDMLSVDSSIIDTIKDRNERIANGQIIWNLGGMSPEGTAIHEWGHIYSNHMVSAMIHDEPEAHEYWEWYKTLSKEEKQLGISAYAAENRAEFEAECFLELQMPNPRPLAVTWWSYMEKILAKGY